MPTLSSAELGRLECASADGWSPFEPSLSIGAPSPTSSPERSVLSRGLPWACTVCMYYVWLCMYMDVRVTMCSVVRLCDTAARGRNQQCDRVHGHHTRHVARDARSTTTAQLHIPIRPITMHGHVTKSGSWPVLDPHPIIVAEVTAAAHRRPSRSTPFKPVLWFCIDSTRSTASTASTACQ